MGRGEGSGAGAATKGEALRPYYLSKIEQCEILLAEKLQNLHRLEAQRNELNSKGTRIRRSRVSNGLGSFSCVRSVSPSDGGTDVLIV
jgi:hypothetical protein